MINRVILIVLDGAGVGELPDAKQYGDINVNTIGNILDAMGDAFTVPNLERMGLYKILQRKSSTQDNDIIACYGKMMTQSPAKDTTAGHWEIAGIIMEKPLPTFPYGFPKAIIDEFEKRTGKPILGNIVASGTEIIKALGDEHIRTGYPIIYTSADSVFQIAAHEEKYGLENLYRSCKIAREILQGDYAVGRVIARPFTGSSGNYIRTANRRDFSISPYETTILDEIKDFGGEVKAIGKIEDIFNGKGITKAIHTECNLNGMEITLEEIKNTEPNKRTLIFTNLVDFDMLWGHRRDFESYAKALKDFDNFIPSLIQNMQEEDILIITADHGCDPTYKAHTDHTREYVPLMVYGKKLKRNVNLGIRNTLSDIGQTIANIFELPELKNGKSFKNDIL